VLTAPPVRAAMSLKMGIRFVRNEYFARPSFGGGMRDGNFEQRKVEKLQKHAEC